MDDLIALAHVPLDWRDFQVASLPNVIFFQEIDDFLDDEIREYAGNLLGRVAAITGAVVLSLLTLWILIQGYRIATGQSRESMMALVTGSLRAVLIIGIATGAAAGAGSLYGTLTDGLTDTINAVMTGAEDGGADQDIDKALAIMQAAFEVIDSVDSGGNAIIDNDKAQALWLAGIGLGGPAIMAATALLLNKIAMALIIGLGPIFILCLLFEPTKPLFGKWLYYGIGTLFSMALLSVMVTLALDTVIAVGLAFWVGDWLSGGQEGLTALAMQQGGLGLILTMLIISVPPMVAMFFRGVMGQFVAYSAFGQGQRIPTPAQAPLVVRDQGISLPMPAFRDPSTQFQPADEIKQAPLQRMFAERYPNALVALDGHGGGGDPLPVDLQTLVRTSQEGHPKPLEPLGPDSIKVIGSSDRSSSDVAEITKIVASDLRVVADMIDRSGDAELAERYRNLSVEIDLDDWAIKYKGTQAAYGYGQAHYDDTKIILNARRVTAGRSTYERVEHTVHELRHLMTENNDMKATSADTPGSQIEGNARQYAREFMNSHWRPDYEFSR